MTVRLLLVALDDEQPLGPQVRAARAVLDWQTVADLLGNRYSLRHLKRIEDMSENSDRQTVQHCTMMNGLGATFSAEANLVSLFSPSGQTWLPLPTPTPAPTVPVPNTADATAAGDATRLAAARQIGRSATILEDYGTAIQPAPARAATLGASA